jgi:hypothetical protein
VNSTFAKILAVTVIASAALVTGAMAQSTEIKPFDVESSPSMPTLYRSQYWVADFVAQAHARLREEARKTYWVEEAEIIARSGQKVVRDGDELYIDLDVPEFPRAVVMRNIWGFDPGVNYLYRFFDDVGRFHVVLASMVDNEGYILLVSAKTGLIYRLSGTPVYSPTGLGSLLPGTTVAWAAFREYRSTSTRRTNSWPRRTKPWVAISHVLANGRDRTKSSLFAPVPLAPARSSIV